MKATFLKLATVFLLSAAFLGNSAEAAGNVGLLSGAWEVQGTPDHNNCGAIPFTNLVAVTRDGTITNVDPVLGAGIGEAYRIKRRTFAAGFFGFINDNGVVLRYEVQGSLKLNNPGQFSGKFRTILYDPSNTPFCEYEGTISGSRLVAVPY